MDIFSIAKKREETMEKLYRQLAEENSGKGLSKVFTLLADEESKHKDFVDDLERKERLSNIQERVELAPEDILRDLKARRDFVNISDSQLELYKEARDFELDSIKLYKKFLSQAETSELKSVLVDLVAEEERHYNILGDIVEFVSRPESWVEDAEFGNREPY